MSEEENILILGIMGNIIRTNPIPDTNWLDTMHKLPALPLSNNKYKERNLWQWMHSPQRYYLLYLQNQQSYDHLSIKYVELNLITMCSPKIALLKVEHPVLQQVNTGVEITCL